jgi:hypothetical protein
MPEMTNSDHLLGHLARDIFRTLPTFVVIVGCQFVVIDCETRGVLICLSRFGLHHAEAAYLSLNWMRYIGRIDRFVRTRREEIKTLEPFPVALE